MQVNRIESREELDQLAMSKVFGGRAEERMTPTLSSQLSRRESPFASSVAGLKTSSWQQSG